MTEIHSRHSLNGSTTESFKLSITTADKEGFYFERYITLIKSVVGATGADGKTYWIDCDVASLKRNIGGEYTPSKINITPMVRSGNNGALAYACYIEILESTDGVNYVSKYFSSISFSCPKKLSNL